MPSLPSTQAQSSQATNQREQNKHFWLNATSGWFIGLAESLVDTRVVMSTFLAQLTDSNALISLLAPAREAGWWLPQFFIAGWVDRHPIKATIYRATNIWRVLSWLALVICCFVLNGPALLIAFALCIIPISIGAGIAGLPWTVMTAKTVPAHRRGILFSWRNGGAALLGILSGPILSFILGGRLGFAFPQNFGIVFALSSIVYVGGYVLMGAINDTPDPPPPTSPTLRQQTARALALLRNSPPYRNFIFARLMITFGFACAPFFAVFARRELNLDPAYLGYFISTSLGSSLIGNFMFGRLGDLRGHKTVLVTCALFGILLALVGLVLTRTHILPIPLLFSAYAFSGLLTASLSTSFSPFMMDVTPSESRPLYYGFTHTLMGFGVIASGLVGTLADVIGFSALYAVCLVLFVLAFVMMARLEDPRPRPPPT